jgi:hypothetical protein
MSTRRLAMCAVSAAAAVTLAACGVGTSSHVVKGVSQTTATSTPTSTVTTGSSVAPVPTTPASTTPTTTTPSDVLGSQTLDQVAAELGALDNSLNTANSDLNNPQGDS